VAILTSNVPFMCFKFYELVWRHSKGFIPLSTGTRSLKIYQEI